MVESAPELFRHTPATRRPAANAAAAKSGKVPDMEAAALTPIADWESFYVIVGSSAGALTGLQFVVMALVAERRHRSTEREVNAFGTPNVVHFCAALLISAVLSAPWHGLRGPAVILGATGLAGVGYVGVVVRRARRQTGYQPVTEDWVWHAVLPLAAYVAILAASIFVTSRIVGSLFAVAAAALLLVFVGIHNAWDTVMFIALARAEQKSD